MIERRAPTTSVPAVPPHFVRHFVEGGWREVERVYGCRTQLLMTWIEMSGGMEQLQSERRTYRQRKAEEAKLTIKEYRQRESDREMQQECARYREDNKYEAQIEAKRQAAVSRGSVRG